MFERTRSTQQRTPANPCSSSDRRRREKRSIRCSTRDPRLVPSPALFLVLLAVSPSFQPLSKAWARSGSCKSGLKCENGGVCVADAGGTNFCRCRQADSALQPQFFVGARCQIPAVMCADTSSFYCAQGSRCVEIVQGENYICDGCNHAVAGPHCDAEGVPCGPNGLQCFNGGLCAPSGIGCLCPASWSGNLNCTARTPGYGHGEEGASWQGDEEQPLLVPLLGALGALVMLAMIGGLIFFCCPKQAGAPPATRKDSDTEDQETWSLQEHGVSDDVAENDGDMELSRLREAQFLRSDESDSS